MVPRSESECLRNSIQRFTVLHPASLAKKLSYQLCAHGKLFNHAKGMKAKYALNTLETESFKSQLKSGSPPRRN